MAPKSILITGASRGLGLEFVRQLLAGPSPPAVLIATCRNPETAGDLQALAKKHACLKLVKLDVRKDDEIRAAFKEAGKILGQEGLNLLINNAGIHNKDDGGELMTQTRERLMTHFDTNTASMVMMVQTFVPLLKMAANKNRNLPMGPSRAAVVNMSSILGSVEEAYKAYYCEGENVAGNVCRRYHYRATKAAVNVLTALMCNELRGDGILVVPLHPGWVQTDMGGQEADIDKGVSIKGLLSTIGSLNEDSIGKLWNYDGTALPW